MMGIYAYFDKKDNSVVYVGKDSYIDKNHRHIAHNAPSHYNKQPINRVLQNNQGRYKYQILVNDVETKKELNVLEMQYISLFNPKFNFTRGGGADYLSEEHRKKMSKSLKGKKRSLESRKNISEGHKGEKNYWFGKKLPSEHRIKISAKRNSTGYYRVCKFKNKKCKQGFYYGYQYYGEDGKQMQISSINISKLEQKVKAKGLEWYKLEEVDLR